jgi:hypothetical protein
MGPVQENQSTSVFIQVPILALLNRVMVAMAMMQHQGPTHGCHKVVLAPASMPQLTLLPVSDIRTTPQGMGS